MRVMPPPDRIDLELAEDLIEELGRLVGYEHVMRSTPRFPAAPISVPAIEERQRIVEDVLVSFGFSETERYIFSSTHELEEFGLVPAEHIEIHNPPSALFQYLQSTVLVGLLSLHRRDAPFPQRIFEFAPTFVRERGGLVERRSLGLLLKEQPESVEHGIHHKAPALFEAKGILQEVFRALGLADVWYKPYSNPPAFLHAKQSAALMVGDEMVGYLGVLAPGLRKKFSKGVALAELDFGRVAELASEEHEYRSPSPYPEAVRDIAVLVPQETLSDEVGQVIDKAGGDLVRDVDLFDYYEGDDLPDGKKSLAFHIFYQAQDRTLTDTEVGAAHHNIESALRQRGWEVR